MNHIKLLFSVCLVTLLLMSQTVLNSADESALLSVEKDVVHPLDHSKQLPNTETSFSSIRKLRINIKRRARGGSVVGGRSTGSSAASAVYPNSFHVFSVLGFSLLFSLLFL
ncbi:hypothetical protein QQ045_033684 [Rhodiola kirilowii]